MLLPEVEGLWKKGRVLVEVSYKRKRVISYSDGLPCYLFIIITRCYSQLASSFCHIPSSPLLNGHLEKTKWFTQPIRQFPRNLDVPAPP